MIVRWHASSFKASDVAMHTIMVVPCAHLLPIWIDLDVSILLPWEGCPEFGMGPRGSHVEYVSAYACVGGIAGQGLYTRILDKV